MSQVLFSFGTDRQKQKRKTAQPMFTATENLSSDRKQTRTKDNKVDLLVENTWASIQLLSGHCLTSICPSWSSGLT